MTHERCGDLAEFYALGILGDAERTEVEQHLRECPACAHLVGAAENDVATIASTEPILPAPVDLHRRVDRLFQRERARSFARLRTMPWGVPAAVAAALIVGTFPSIYFWSQSQAVEVAMQTQSAAMERIASEPHRIASFAAMPPTATAQVAYAADGSWYVIVVRGESKPLSVAWMHGGKKTMLGDAVPQGNLAMLYLPKSHRMEHLALMDGDRIVAQATLSWQKTSPNRQGDRSS
jgi:anti-sigma-K factor RskA